MFYGRSQRNAKERPWAPSFNDDDGLSTLTHDQTDKRKRPRHPKPRFNCVYV